ncbi:hypothetical protein Droror1_Dr00005430 [Drosera rotundifolia]
MLRTSRVANRQGQQGVRKYGVLAMVLRKRMNGVRGWENVWVKMRGKGRDDRGFSPGFSSSGSFSCTLENRSKKPPRVTNQSHFPVSHFPITSSPPLTLYDYLAAAIKPKLDRLLSSDPRFLLDDTPHPSPTLVVPPLPSTRITVLPFGLRIVTKSYLTVRSVAIGVWIDADSIYKADEKGIGLLSVKLGMKNVTPKPVETRKGITGDNPWDNPVSH